MYCTRDACNLRPKLTSSELVRATPTAASVHEPLLALYMMSQCLARLHMMLCCLEACRPECSLCTLMLQSSAAELAV